MSRNACVRGCIHMCVVLIVQCVCYVTAGTATAIDSQLVRPCGWIMYGLARTTEVYNLFVHKKGY